MKVPLFDETFSGISDWDLSDRDVDVVAFLSEEDFCFFTFEGLKRRLGLHPETLSRILNRLEIEGIIKKSREGYTVAKDVVKHLKTNVRHCNYSTIRLLQTFLPSDLSVNVLISNLQGKWFGLLRWLGLARTDKNLSLKWITEDGDIQVNAKIVVNTLEIEAKFLHGFNKDLALKAAYQLIAHIGKLCSQNRVEMAKHVAYFEDQNYHAMPS